MKKVIAISCSLVLGGAQLSMLPGAQARPIVFEGACPAALAQQGTASPGGTATTYNAGKAKGAEALVKELEKLVDVQQTPETVEAVQKLEKEGQDLFDRHNLSQALIKWQEMYGRSLEMKYADGQGRALTDMAKIYVEQGQWVKAKALGENAIEVLASSNQEESLARARVVLAQAYFGLDNPTWAVQQLDAALKVLAGGRLSNDEEAGRIMYLCASLCLKFGKTNEAIRYFQEGASYSYQKGDIAKAIGVRCQIVDAMLELGWYVAALEEANRVVSMAKSAPQFSNLYQINAYQVLANAQFAANEVGNARRSYEQVYALIAKADPKMVSDVTRANVDEGYGFVLATSGENEQARNYFLKAIAAFKARNDNYNLTQVYNALGVLEVHEGQIGKGLGYFQQALDYHAVLKPKSPRLNAITLVNQACAETRSGSFRDAKNHLEGAVACLGKLPEPLLRARIAQCLAEVSLKAADVTSAESYLAKALENSPKYSDDANLWRCYTLKAKMQLAKGEVEPAKESLTSALSYFRSPQAGDFPCADVLGYPTNREDFATLLISMLASQGMTEQALLAAEQLKEENFINEWMKRSGQVKPEDRDAYNELFLQRAHLHSAESATTPNKIVKEWQSWMERFRGVVQTNRTLARLIAPVPSSAEEIVAAVQKNKATVLEYLVGPDSTIVFTIDPAGRISSTNLPVGRARLRSLVQALLVSANAHGVDTTAGVDSERVVLKGLYSALLPASVRQFLPRTPEQMIVVIPDGPLYNLPFAALVDDQGKFFVENHLLTMASSMSVILDSPPRIADTLSVLMASSNNTANSSESAEEQQISSAVGPELVTTLLGKDAAIANIEEQTKGKSVLHITAKLPLIESNPLRSVLPILGDKEDSNRKVTADRLCGTSLASDLIVWSCSSVNSKDVKGTAVKVFSRGLNYAGARNVLLSLWTEPDSQRVDELVSFYKGKQAGLNPAQSLRKAQISALTRDPSVRNWAAFQLLGPGY